MFFSVKSLLLYTMQELPETQTLSAMVFMVAAIIIMVLIVGTIVIRTKFQYGRDASEVSVYLPVMIGFTVISVIGYVIYAAS